LVEVGSLGITFESDNGFDIGGTSNLAFAELTTGGRSSVYGINLMTGVALKVSDLDFNPNSFAMGLEF
jgi:hypothetical protein